MNQDTNKAKNMKKETHNSHTTINDNTVLANTTQIVLYPLTKIKFNHKSY